MASSINASVSGAGGVITTADNTGILQLQAAGTTIATVSSTGLALNTGNITLPSGAAPAFSYSQSSAQTLSSNTTTKVTFTSSEFDTTSGMFASSRFTPTVAGYYQITTGVSISTTNTAGTLYLYKNNANFKFMNQTGTAAMGSMFGTALVYLNGSTDYIEIYANITIGQSLIASSSLTYFQGFMARSA
jgi:hypothetical protein